MTQDKALTDLMNRASAGIEAFMLRAINFGYVAKLTPKTSNHYQLFKGDVKFEVYMNAKGWHIMGVDSFNSNGKKTTDTLLICE